MMICLGGVCIPLNLLIPFLVGVMHRYGWFKWFRQEWVTVSYWKKEYNRWSAPMTGPEASTGTPPSRSAKEKAEESDLKADMKDVDKAAATINPRAEADKESLSLRRRGGQDDQKTNEAN